jgi:hypothetical protein
VLLGCGLRVALGSEKGVSLFSTNEGEGEIPPNRIPSLGSGAGVVSLFSPIARGYEFAAAHSIK